MSDHSHRVIDTIEQAFAGVQLKEGLTLREAIVLDNYGTVAERQQARSQGELGDWRSIPDETIACYSASLAFLDATAMRFYLPAFMRFALRHYGRSDSPSINYTIHVLEPFRGSGAANIDFVFEKLTEEQRQSLGKALATTEPREGLNAKFKDLHTYQAEKFSLLTEAQRDAVRAFLEFMAAKGV